MVNGCNGNCIACGRCATGPILDRFTESGRSITPRDGYGIAIDIGTTTVVLALIDLSAGKTTTRHSFLNPQRMFGPDVISRIDAANKGKCSELSQAIKDSVSDGITALLAAGKVSPGDVVDISIAGNTVMIHLLLGFPCESLGVSPFTITHRLAARYDSAGLFGSSCGVCCDVIIIPWMVAYVGGDITAGLIHVLPDSARRFLLMDLGTNGEMALYCDGRLIVTATAAGPAFEQPIMSAGVREGIAPAFSGASDVIAALAALVREEALDETGLLQKEDVFTQKQVREIQLAKSAIRSGLEIILEAGGLGYDDLDAVYLAGGIGRWMNVKDAVAVGIIPPELEAKARPAGNASLGGAMALLTSPALATADMERLLLDVLEINLVQHPRFNEYFMEYMFF